MQKLHDKTITHRNLSLDTIQVRMKNSKVSLILSAFDIAIQLKKGAMIAAERINSTSRLAPELESGTASSDMAVDIWALGQICYQLMCCCIPTENTTLQLEDQSAFE